MKQHSKIDRGYESEGEFITFSLFEFDFFSSLVEDNKGKLGRPYEYPDVFFEKLGVVRSFFNLGYRQLKGFTERLFGLAGCVFPVPSYKTMWRRIMNLPNKLKMECVEDSGEKLLDSQDDLHDHEVDCGVEDSGEKLLDSLEGVEGVGSGFCSDKVSLVIDSSGLKMGNSGGWMSAKWRVRKSWVKLHVTLNVRTYEVVNAVVTTEGTGDSKVGRYVVNLLDGKKVGKFLADGAYDTNEIFEALREKKIESIIPPRKNATSKRGSRTRREETKLMKKVGKNLWTELKDYGKRWHVEIWFSAYKRRFGEKIKATSWKGTIKEILNNIHTLNLIYKKKNKPPDPF